jgi:hypothetical protein
VLGITLAKLSASVPPRIRIDTGVRKRRMPLNTYGGLVGKTGGFKSSAADAVKGSVMFTQCAMTGVLRDRLGLFSPIGEDSPYGPTRGGPTPYRRLLVERVQCLCDLQIPAEKQKL